jgi:hypothetical protein
MKTLVGCVISIVLVASLSFAQETTSEKWNLFKSTTGFAVSYPASWFRKGISTDRLMILSSKGGAEALIIKRGQAVISVMEEREYLNASLSDVVDKYVKDTEVLSRTNIQNQNAGIRGCRELLEIVSKLTAVSAEDVPGPVPFFIYTEYFCEVNGHKYVTVLRNFEGDKKQGAYQEIALRVAKSLRAYE